MKAQVLSVDSFAGTFEAVPNTLDSKHPAMDSAWISTSSLKYFFLCFIEKWNLAKDLSWCPLRAGR
jgi:hypothetical protein